MKNSSHSIYPKMDDKKCSVKKMNNRLGALGFFRLLFFLGFASVNLSNKFDKLGSNLSYLDNFFDIFISSGFRFSNQKGIPVA